MSLVTTVRPLIRRKLLLLLALLTVLPVGIDAGDHVVEAHTPVGLLAGAPHDGTTAPAAGMSLPPGFAVRTVVSGLRLPTDFVFLPSGDMLVTEKGRGAGVEGVAQVRWVRQGVLQPEPVLELSVAVPFDSGLTSIVLDPHFAHNGHFYLWYSTGNQAVGWTGAAVNRLSRFTFDPATGRADPAGETIILDNVPWSGTHNGGGLYFDPNGNLLIAMGDVEVRAWAQDYNRLVGKLLRIRPNSAGGYTIPADNPYADGNTQVNGVTPLPEIYAAGLRNPFRMTERRRDGALFMAEVGLTDWEEVNQVIAGANYGWAVREGPCPFRRSGDECTPAPPEFTDPVLAYPRPSNGGSLVGIAFYEGRFFPVEQRGKLFFADFNNRLLFSADLDAGGTHELFAAEVGNIVDIEAADDGLYLLDIYTGRIHFLYYDGSGNRQPVPVFAATPTLGGPPLEVQFSAAGTQDPDDQIAFYRWSFGDGSAPVTTTVPTASHVYTSEGNHMATLQVVDVRGGESESVAHEITVYGGAMPVIVQHNPAEPGRMTYEGGDAIRFTVQRDGDLAGLDPVTPFRWDIDFHHNDHTHPVVSDYAADEVTLEIPLHSHDLDSLLWYRIYVTMQTADGLRVRISHDVQPHLSTLQVVSAPSGAPLTINELPIQPLTPVPVVVGQHYELGTPLRIISAGRVAQFSAWGVLDSWPLDPGLGNYEVLPLRTPTIVARAQPKIYAAFYDDVEAAQTKMLPLLFATSGP